MSLDVLGFPQVIQALQFRSRNTFATLITNHLPLNFLVTNARLYKMVASVENLATQIDKMPPEVISINLSKDGFGLHLNVGEINEVATGYICTKVN